MIRPIRPDETMMRQVGRPPHLGDDDRLPVRRDPRNTGMLSSFMPGQLGMLAQQLNAGFGGGQKAWRNSLMQPYIDASKVQYGEPEEPTKDPKNRRNRDGRDDQPDNPDPTDPNYPHTRGNFAMQPPAMNGGMFGAQQQISPQILQLIRQRLGGMNNVR